MSKTKKTKQEKIEYYDIEHLVEKKAIYNIIVGERSNGKTYSALLHGLKKFLDTGLQIAYVRRWKDDITGKRAKMVWDGILNDNKVYELTDGEYEGIHYYAGAYYLCNYENSKAIYNKDDVFAYAFSLSDTEHNKSVTYSKIGTIIFDEFITKGTYLVDEFVIFMNTVSSIVRKRTNVTIFMLGNTVNKYNPYFKEMGLEHANQMVQGTIDIYKYGNSELTVAVEYCASSKTRSLNNFYFAFNNPKLSMITSGAWELDLYPHLPVKYRPKDVLLTFFIIFSNQTFQCQVVSVGDISFIYIHEKTTPIKDKKTELIYSLEYNPRLNYSRSIYFPINKAQKRILWFFETDRVYYQDNAVGDAVSNFLKVCNK